MTLYTAYASIKESIKERVNAMTKEININKKARIELAKTIVITVLITGIVAFMFGIHYQSRIDAQKSVVTMSKK